MAGQVRHTDPRQDEEPGVVGDQAQMARALLGAPANPRVARRCLPGRRTKQETSQRPTVLAPRQVLQVLAHAIAMPQIVVALQKEPEQRSLRTTFGERLHPYR